MLVRWLRVPSTLLTQSVSVSRCRYSSEFFLCCLFVLLLVSFCFVFWSMDADEIRAMMSVHCVHRMGKWKVWAVDWINEWRLQCTQCRCQYKLNLLITQAHWLWLGLRSISLMDRHGHRTDRPKLISNKHSQHSVIDWWLIGLTREYVRLERRRRRRRRSALHFFQHEIRGAAKTNGNGYMCRPDSHISN